MTSPAKTLISRTDLNLPADQNQKIIRAPLSPMTATKEATKSLTDLGKATAVAIAAAMSALEKEKALATVRQVATATATEKITANAVSVTVKEKATATVNHMVTAMKTTAKEKALVNATMTETLTANVNLIANAKRILAKEKLMANISATARSAIGLTTESHARAKTPTAKHLSAREMMKTESHL